MALPYIPPGYVWLVQAVKEAAERLHPEHWAELPLPTREAEAWRAIVRRELAPELVGDHLRIAILRDRDEGCQGADGPAWINRYCDYMDAQKALRDGLFEGRIAALYFDDEGSEQKVKPQSWASDAGATALAKGIADMDEGEYIVTRLLLLREADVGRLFGLSSSCDGEASGVADVPGSTNRVRTGLAGRPSSIHLILGEAAQRISAGAKPLSKRSFAKELSEWLETEHSDMPQAKPGSILNNPHFSAFCRQKGIRGDVQKSRQENIG